MKFGPRGWPDYLRSINDNDKTKGFKRNIFKRSILVSLLVYKSFKENLQVFLTLFEAFWINPNFYISHN